MSEIIIHIDQPTGPIKPLHGVNNGPIGYGTLLNVSHYYKELRIPFVRLHDTNWPHPREVDIPTIFPDFSKDPDNPASYDFRRTDTYIKSVLDTGAKIVYRLGTSIEHTKTKYYTHPPANIAKWAHICLGIIRHYNCGWAQGFAYDIQYWEIWNEPDNTDGDCMWSGTPELYFDLYKAVSLSIKNFDKNLKVGGFGQCGPYQFTKDFLQFCKTEKLPIDFFSWHTYPNNPMEIATKAHEIKKLVDEYGFSGAEIHLNEWNYISTWSNLFSRLPGDEHLKHEVFQDTKGVKGASFAAAAFCLMQNLPITIANYYDGQPMGWFCGLFDMYGVPQKTYYAFLAFKYLFDMGESIESTVMPGNEGVYCLAAQKSPSESCLLVSCFNSKNKTLAITIDGCKEGSGYRIEHYVINECTNLELVNSCTINGAYADFDIPADGHSVALVKIIGL